MRDFQDRASNEAKLVPGAPVDGPVHLQTRTDTRGTQQYQCGAANELTAEVVGPIVDKGYHGPPCIRYGSRSRSAVDPFG